MKRKNNFRKHLSPRAFLVDPKWCVANRDMEHTCVLMLAGRSHQNNLLPSIYWHDGLRQHMIIGVQTQCYAWYPLPKGEYDSRAAINGIPNAVHNVLKVVSKIEDTYNIPREKIVVLGFSAGGVMAIQVGAHSERPFAGIVCQSGAILDPFDLPESPHPEMPVLLTHSQDDDTFDWEERYIPMKEALIEKNYNLSASENPWGYHSITTLDIAITKLFLDRCFDPNTTIAEK